MIADARVLDPEFVPKDVVHRDAEINLLSSVLRPVTNGDTTDPASIHGPMEIDQIRSAGDYVVVRWRQTGTHVEKMGRVEPTNEEVTPTGIEIARIEAGKLAETWDEVNVLPLLAKSETIPEDLLAPELPADD